MWDAMTRIDCALAVWSDFSPGCLWLSWNLMNILVGKQPEVYLHDLSFRCANTPKGLFYHLIPLGKFFTCVHLPFFIHTIFIYRKWGSWLHTSSDHTVCYIYLRKLSNWLKWIGNCENAPFNICPHWWRLLACTSDQSARLQRDCILGSAPGCIKRWQ